MLPSLSSTCSTPSAPLPLALYIKLPWGRTKTISSLLHFSAQLSLELARTLSSTLSLTLDPPVRACRPQFQTDEMVSMVADEKAQPQLLSKKATSNSHGQDSSYFLGWEEYEKNPYDPIANPGGIIQMGLAENQLSFDLLEAWLEANPDALGLRSSNGASVFRELALFQDYHGLPAFKNVSPCSLPHPCIPNAGYLVLLCLLEVNKKADPHARDLHRHWRGSCRSSGATGCRSTPATSCSPPAPPLPTRPSCSASPTTATPSSSPRHTTQGMCLSLLPICQRASGGTPRDATHATINYC